MELLFSRVCGTSILFFRYQRIIKWHRLPVSVRIETFIELNTCETLIEENIFRLKVLVCLDFFELFSNWFYMQLVYM